MQAFFAAIGRFDVRFRYVIVAVWLISRSGDVMGGYRSGWLSTSLVWLACAGMAAAAAGLVVSLVRQ